MAINTTFREVKLDYERALAPKQIVMQCNLDTSAKGGAQKVCFVTGDVVITKAQALSKQIKVSGRAGVKLVYLGADGQIKSFDYISDFAEDISDDLIAADMPVRVSGQIVDTETSLSDDEIKVQIVVQLDGYCIESQTEEFLAQTSGALQQRKKVRGQTFVEYLDQEVELSDEYESGVCVQEIILFDVKAQVTRTQCTGDKIVVEGQASADIVYLAEEVLTPKTITIPFVHEIAGHDGDMAACIECVVKDSKLVLLGTEKDNTLRVELRLGLQGALFCGEEISLVDDMFCPESELQINRRCLQCSPIVESFDLSERIGGEAGVEENGVRKIMFRTVVGTQVSNAIATENALNVEGLVTVGVVYQDEENQLKCVQIELPYAVAFDREGICDGDTACVRCMASDVGGKVKRDSQIELSVELKFYVCLHREESVCGIVAVEEGQPRAVSNSGIVVYFPKEGETMWEVSKALAMPAEEIMAQNPYAGGEMTGEERLVVYKMLSV